MKQFFKIHKSVKSLIELLYGQRALLSAMFHARKRFDFRYEDALDHVANEKNLSLLIDYNVIRREGDLLELEDAYMRFLEEVLSVNEEISTASVCDTVTSLRDAIEYYQKERSSPENQTKYMRQIRRKIRTVGQMVTRNVIDLKRNIDDTYKQERNFEIKRSKLQKFLEQIAAISKLIRDTEELLDPDGITFVSFPPDERLSAIITDTRLLLRDAFHSLVDRERTIRDYLHIIDAQSLIVKKIRKLKYLRDQLTWEKSTSVCGVLETCNPLWMEPRARYSLKPSLSALRDDDIYVDVLNQVRRVVRSNRTGRKSGTKFRIESFAQTPVIEDYVDTDAVARAFIASQHDLFSFVLNYGYSTPQTVSQRVEIYTEIVLNHYSEFTITNEWSVDGDISYPLIYAKK